jgi:hypothetical protein
MGKFQLYSEYVIFNFFRALKIKTSVPYFNGNK